MTKRRLRCGAQLDYPIVPGLRKGHEGDATGGAGTRLALSRVGEGRGEGPPLSLSVKTAHCHGSDRGGPLGAARADLSPHAGKVPFHCDT
jgi:hypothetical protein